MARQEVVDGENAAKAFMTLVNQCLRRDPDWKAFYAEQMDGIVPRGPISLKKAARKSFE